MIEVGERDRGGDELAGALGNLTNGQRRSGVDRPGQKVDLPYLEKLLGLLHGDGRVRLLVLVRELDCPAHDAAGSIDLLGRKIEAPAHLLADAGVCAGQRRYNADLDGVGGQGAADGSGAEQQGRANLAAVHGRPPARVSFARAQIRAGCRNETPKAPPSQPLDAPPRLSAARTRPHGIVDERLAEIPNCARHAVRVGDHACK